MASDGWNTALRKCVRFAHGPSRAVQIGARYGNSKEVATWSIVEVDIACMTVRPARVSAALCLVDSRWSAVRRCSEVKP